MTRLLAVSVVAIWILFSSVLAPVYIQRLIARSPGPTSLITKAADLITNTALPHYLGVPAMWRGVSQGSHSAYDFGTRLWNRWHPSPDEAVKARTQTPVPVLPSPPAPGPSTPSNWQPDAQDPTGDRKVSALLDGSRSPRFHR